MESAKELIQMCKENEKQIETIREKEDVERKEYEEKHAKIRDKYWELERQMREQKNKEEAEIEAAYKEVTDRHGAEKTQLSEVIKKVERIMYFIEKRNEKAEFNDEKVKPYDEGKYFECLGDLFKDDLLHIKLYVAEVDRKVNKFCLFALGRSALDDKRIIEVPHYYFRARISTYDAPHNIEVELLFKPTVEELKKYVEKNKDKILKPFIDKYKEVKREFDKTNAKYTYADFEELILLERMRELEHYAHGVSEDHLEEYNVMNKRVEELRSLQA